MNSLKGNITDIEVSGSLSLVTVMISDDCTLKAIVIDTPETVSYLKIGNYVRVLFKETEVIIGLNKNLEISLQNRIKGRVNFIEQGELLSRVIVESESEVGEIVSIISSNAVKNLSLKIGTEVIAMVKLNEMMLSE